MFAVCHAQAMLPWGTAWLGLLGCGCEMVSGLGRSIFLGEMQAAGCGDDAIRIVVLDWMGFLPKAAGLGATGGLGPACIVVTP